MPNPSAAASRIGAQSPNNRLLPGDAGAVRAWVPPSEEHVHFKEFMIIQLDAKHPA